MTEQPARVTPGEISDLLDHARQLISGGASLDEQIVYHERKANLLSRCAADLDTAEAHLVAADAWHYVRTLAARRDASAPEEAAQ
jgi:exonuclease VII small subunit